MSADMSASTGLKASQNPVFLWSSNAKRKNRFLEILVIYINEPFDHK